MRLVIAQCQVDYAGRLTAHLPLATRVIMVKNDGSVLIHSDGGSYKPLNWMSPPCTLREGVADDGVPEWTVSATKTDDTLRIRLEDILHDSSHDLGVDPGLQKDGVEKHLQELLAEHTTALGSGMSLVRREFMTAIGPVDLLCKDAGNSSVAVEIKRRGDIDGVEQLTRYLELMNRDPALRPVRGIFAAQEIKPQARVLAEDRGITCVVVNYDELRGIDDPGLSSDRLRRSATLPAGRSLLQGDVEDFGAEGVPTVDLAAVGAVERGVDLLALVGAGNRGRLGAAKDHGAGRAGRNRLEDLGARIGQLRAGRLRIRMISPDRVTRQCHGPRLSSVRCHHADVQLGGRRGPAAARRVTALAATGHRESREPA